jgi:subtilisin family serine protease
MEDLGSATLLQASLTPYSRQGHSIHDVERVDATNIRDFEPHSGRKRAAARRLRALGLTVIDHGGPALTVRGSRAMFERAFGGRLKEYGRTMTSHSGAAQTARFLSADGGDSPALLPISRRRHPDLSALAQGLAFAEPVQVFAPVSAAPPRVPYHHVSVGAGIRDAVNAGAAHRSGVTGARVRVVICDTGFFQHPWFTARHHVVKVVLTPGAAGPGSDEVGHGTAVAANLLSVAPACEVALVKMSFGSDAGFSPDAVPALQIAARLRADVVNCSWGQSMTSPDDLRSPHARTMELCIAWLTQQGRIVVCAAGNYPRGDAESWGELGFPAQHPDALAVGGVLITSRRRLRAASYASGFASPLYAGRIVPDVCGLCGDLPAGVLIVSPLQPGSIIDRAAAAAAYPAGDGTTADDGWCCISGTSSAAPQVAGVVALALQANRALRDTARMRALLTLTARDVRSGTGNPRSTRAGVGNRAVAGPDLATGAGLVDASAVVAVARRLSGARKTITGGKRRA